MTTATVLIDEALDQYIKVRAAYRRQHGLPDTLYVFTARGLAGVAEVSVTLVSAALQEYKDAQARDGATRYVIGCQGYGERAPWYILAKPDDDPAEVRRARRFHLHHVAADSAKRFVRDARREVYPGLQNNRADKLIGAVARMHERNLLAQLELVHDLLDGEAPPEPERTTT